MAQNEEGGEYKALIFFIFELVICYIVDLRGKNGPRLY